MKYIRTLQNLRKLMDYAQEIVNYEKRDYGDMCIERYEYEDDKYEFCFRINNSVFGDELTVSVKTTCEWNDYKDYPILALLIYTKDENGEWVYNSKRSLIREITLVNKELRDTVKQIKADTYTPVSEEEKRELTQNEKSEFVNWLLETMDIDEESREVAEFTLNYMKNEEYTAEGTFRNGKLIEVSLVENADSVHENGFTWTLHNNKMAFVNGSFTFDNKSNFFYGSTGKFEFEEKENSPSKNVKLALLKTQFPECEEKEKFEELRKKALNDLENVEFTDESDRGILAVAYGIDNDNYFILQFDEDDESQTYSLQGKHKGRFILSNFEIVDNQAIDFRDVPLTEDEDKELNELLGKLGITELIEKTEKAEQLSEKDNALPVQTNQDNYNSSEDFKEDYNQEIIIMLNEFILENELVQKVKNMALNDIESCIYTPVSDSRHLEYIGNVFNSYFHIDDLNKIQSFYIYFRDNGRHIEVKNDFTGNIFIEGCDNEFSQSDAIRKLQTPDPSGVENFDEIEVIDKPRMVRSEAIEEAIQEFIYKGKNGELLRTTDEFYTVLESNSINWVIELLNSSSCEITCLVPDNKERFVIELGYDNTDYYSETINRIDYHVDRSLEV